jgi:DNA-binding beta-propeller fold protein YncE
LNPQGRHGIVVAVLGMTRLRGPSVVPGRALPALCLGLLAACLTAAPAGAAQYSLTPAGCIEDGGSPADCAANVPSLDGPAAVAVSPDGASVYVAAGADGAIAIFRRAADGSLTPQGCVGDAGTTTCGTGPDDRQEGLDGVADLTVTPDGRHVFAVSPVEGTIVHLRRDPSTGALTPGGCYDGPGGPDLCFFQIAGLDGARTVAAVDPPGGDAFVFVGASTFGDNGTLLRFLYGTVNLEDGGCVFTDADDPVTGCAVAEGLGGVDDLAFSPDAAGESLYAVAKEDDAIARFDQHGSTLAYSGCIADQTGGEPACAATAPGLQGPRGVTVSLDGSQVYVAALSSSALTEFNRDDRGLVGTADGALSPIGCVNEVGTGPACGLSAPGLDAAFNVAAAPDGESVYVASVGGGLADFARPRPTGPLDPNGCLEAPGSGAGCERSAPGLGVNLGLAISPDGRSLYATSTAADTLAVFRRAPVEAPSGPPSDPPSGPPAEPPPGTPPPGSPPGAPGGTPAAPPAQAPHQRPPASGGALARLRVVGLERDRRAGTATLTVAVPRAGVLKLRRGRYLRPARRRAAGAAVRIVLRPDRRGRRRLRKQGAVAVKARLALASGTETTTTTKRVRLLQRRPRR